jgi:ABC-type glycerol-3-phosphate transport system permease component
MLIVITLLTMLPFFFVVNNSFRTNNEMYRSYFAPPKALTTMALFTWFEITGRQDKIIIHTSKDAMSGDVDLSAASPQKVRYSEAMGVLWNQLTRGYRHSWNMLKPYMLNTFFVCLATAMGVILLGSMTAYVFSRYDFPGKQLLFMIILSMMMVPAVLTLVPSFLLVKKLNLLNSYWVLILPYVSGGQVIAIFLFKSFFDGLPEELFESARLDGAGHLTLYLQIVLPLSKQIMAVVLIMSVLGTWNNFLWPFIANSDPRYHVVASGLYLMSQTIVAENFSTMFASYVLSSVPLLILFIYGTKHFITGVTSGAFKA